MIDLHCHILPGVDDGPADLEGSLAMARLAVADGTRQLAATPHLSAGLSRADIEGRVAELQLELNRAGIGLELVVGADAATSLGVEVIREHPLAEGPYMLIEFPHSHLPLEEGRELVFELLTHDRIPIITHPERNPSVVRAPELVAELVEAGALVQLTAESLSGGFGNEARACARHLLRRGQVHILASDGHSDSWRPPCLSAGLKVAARLIGKEAARRLVTANPARILAGEEGGWE